MKLIPQQTSPLTKLIRTGEGVLVALSNVALVVVPLVTNALSASTAIKYAVILNGVTVVARSVLKAIASLSGGGVLPPAFLAESEHVEPPPAIATAKPDSAVPPDVDESERHA